MSVQEAGEEFGRAVAEAQAAALGWTTEYGTIRTIQAVGAPAGRRVVEVRIDVNDIEDFPVRRWSWAFARELDALTGNGFDAGRDFVGVKVEVHFKDGKATIAYSVVTGG